MASKGTKKKDFCLQLPSTACCRNYTLRVLVKGEQKFEIDYANNIFLMNGAPFRYVSGSFQYVPWKYHGQSPGVFTWNGAADLGQFLKLAQQAELFVLLRLGSYICVGWIFGGFPAWLLSEDPNMIVGTIDPTYLRYVVRWFTELLNKVKPYLFNSGDPILMVQIENEYGYYFACDQKYMMFFRDKVNSEFYTGYIDYWGSRHSTGDTTKVSKSLDLPLNYSANVNIILKPQKSADGKIITPSIFVGDVNIPDMPKDAFLDQ